jgi:hypothetical protein
MHNEYLLYILLKEPSQGIPELLNPSLFIIIGCTHNVLKPGLLGRLIRNCNWIRLKKKQEKKKIDVTRQFDRRSS